jgi:low temperature requirement protein LtrA
MSFFQATGFARFRRWFWRPPRAHGEADAERTVTFLELFYDLTYVVVVAQAAHHLAEHLSPQGFVEFAIIFGLIWIAWLNGTQYYELHGREDGRTRTFVFTQMALLALLAVFTAEAATDSGSAFALVYAAFLGVLTWLWYSVRRWDAAGFSEMSRTYIVGMVVTISAVLVSAVVPEGIRLAIWAAVVVAWLVGLLGLTYLPRFREAVESGLAATESMVERFGLFTIIVLGEVVVGVVNGLSAAPHDALTIITGMLALTVGFGLWWVFFDLVGRRLPRHDARASGRWMLSHLPIALGIAAAGAAMVTLIEHAHDPRTPPETAWLLAGSVAVTLLALVVTTRALVDYDRQAVVYRPVTWALLAGATAAVLVGWWQPAPWALSAALAAILFAVWYIAVDRWLRLGGTADHAVLR